MWEMEGEEETSRCLPGSGEEMMILLLHRLAAGASEELTMRSPHGRAAAL